MTTGSTTSRRQAEFVDVVASDGRRLEGLLHEPTAPAAGISVLLLHGKGGNFYSGVCRFLPPLLAGAGIRTLALNMRSHDLGYTRVDVPYTDLEEGAALVDGGMWEDLAAGPVDVQAGIEHLVSNGADEVVLCGHSSGGFYAAVHDPTDPRIPARILLSPLVSNRRPLEPWFADRGGLENALAEARALVAAGRGDELIPTGLWYYAISARGLLQRAAEPVGLFGDSIARTGSRLLLGWGSLESRGSQWAQVAEEVPDSTTAIFDGAEHNYLGQEESVAQAIMRFLID